MKKLLVLFLATAIFSPVASAEPSPYDLKGRYPKQTGIYIAPKIVYSINQEVKGIEKDDDSVMGGGIAVGYNFYSQKKMFPVRVEAEYLMRERAKYEFDGLDQSYGVDTIMFNGAIGLNTGTRFTPYITAGIGFSFIDGEFPEAGEQRNGDNEDFAYSVGLDLTYNLNSKVFLSAEYRYSDFGVSDLVTPAAKEQELTAQEVIFALRYKF